MIDMASAPPSTGSVPAPASSSSTRAGVSSAASMATMLAMWPENVLRLCGDRLLVADVGEYRLEHRDLRILGDGDEQSGLGQERQQACRLQRHGLAAGVRTGDHQDVHRRKQRDVDGNRLGVGAAVLTLASRIARLAVPGRAKVATHRRDQQGMAGGSQLEPAILRQFGFDAAHENGETGPRIQHVQFGGGGDRPIEFVRAAAKRVAQRQQDAQDFFVLPAAPARRCRC